MLIILIITWCKRKENVFFQDRDDVMIVLNGTFLILSLVKAKFVDMKDGSRAAHLCVVHVYMFNEDSAGLKSTIAHEGKAAESS